jgi:7-keto-8-aminopelargonate synthetase-like enzyme
MFESSESAAAICLNSLTPCLFSTGSSPQLTLEFEDSVQVLLLSARNSRRARLWSRIEHLSVDSSRRKIDNRLLATTFTPHGRRGDTRILLI